MNMILTGDGHNNIQRQDSLKNPSEKKYDVVITNMPFSLGNFEEYSSNYSLGNPNGNSLCIEHCFDAIDSKSGNPRIGIIIPEGILFDRKFTKLRDYIYRNSDVESIVSLPSGAFKPYTDVKTSMLYLTKVKQKKEQQKFVWHFSVKNDGHALNTKRQKKEGENDLDIFLSFNNSESEDTLLHIGFNKLDMEAIKKNNYISIPNPYKKFEFNSKFETIALAELIGEITTRNNENAIVWSVTNDKGFVPSDSRFDEQVASDDTSNYKIVPLNGFAYNPARINVGSIAFNDSQEMGCVSPMYVVFKCKNEKILTPKYLYWLLQSDNLKEQIKHYAFGSVRQTLNFDDFYKMVIPIPNIEVQTRVISELESYGAIAENIKRAVENWKPYFEINQEYKTVRLDEVCAKITDGSHNPPPALSSGNLMLSAVNITNFDIVFDPNKIRYISEDDFKQENKRTDISTGDVLLSIVGTIGKTAIVQENHPKFTLQRSVAVIKCNSKLIDNRYLMYFFCSEQAKQLFRK
jgi:type I restriction enzyme M protein